VKSLFLRIFLWFWAAMVVMVAVLVVSSPFFTKSHPGVERWQRESGQFLSDRVDRVAERIERGERDAADPDRPRRRHRSPMRIFILDAHGVEVEGREVDDDVRELASRALEEGDEINQRTGSLHLGARPVVDPDHGERVVVGALRRPPRPIDLISPRVLLPRLAALTVVVGLFCLLLARHLSSPVASLRVATRRLADGDLSARVGQRVARRSDEIGQLARDFDGMAERLEGLLGSQKRLLRDVSHELRSPLARLEVALELARQRAGEGAAESLDRIGRESRNLDHLVEQLLSLERLEAGSQAGTREVVDLAALVEAVVADARFEAEALGCDVTAVVDEQPKVRGSSRLIHSAVENVVRNGVAHTVPNTVVEVAVGRRNMHGGSVAEVRVRDHGPGVPEEQVERLFEPFHRVEDARDRDSGGVGLGLAIAERAIRAHGGEIEASNHPDGGLEVRIVLPITDR
jgi:two-component system sensor histidine kinase CpxA